MRYNPEYCDICGVKFETNDEVIMHDDIKHNWFFCSDDCYQSWLTEYKVKKIINVGQEYIEEEDVNEIL